MALPSITLYPFASEIGSDGEHNRQDTERGAVEEKVFNMTKNVNNKEKGNEINMSSTVKARRKIKAHRTAKEARLAQEAMMEMIDHQATEMMRAILENQVSKKYGDAVVDLFKVIDKHVTDVMFCPEVRASKSDEKSYDFFFNFITRTGFRLIPDIGFNITYQDICGCYKSAMAALQEVNLDGWRLVRYSDFNSRVIEGRCIDDVEGTALCVDSVILAHLYQFKEMRRFLRGKSGDFFAVYNNGNKLSKFYHAMLAQDEHDSEDAA